MGVAIGTLNEAFSKGVNGPGLPSLGGAAELAPLMAL
jgi:hypothetical protein